MATATTAATTGSASVKTAQPRLKQKYRSEIAAKLTKDFSFTNVHQVPGLVKIVVNTGVGEAARDGKVIDGAIKDLTADHRPEAAGHQGPQVHRAVQAARGPADRRPRHAARRPGMGVPRPPAVARASAHPRLPRTVGQAVRRQRQLHFGLTEQSHLPRDRPGPDRPRSRFRHHGRHHREERRRGSRAAARVRLPVPQPDTHRLRPIQVGPFGTRVTHAETETRLRETNST